MATGFGASVRANVEKVLQQTADQAMTIAVDLFTGAVKRTPSPTYTPTPEYAKGVLANQWYPHIGPQFSAEMGGSADDSGQGSIDRITGMFRGQKAGVDAFRKDNTVTLANNIPYAILAEKYGWQAPMWSGKVGPYRMVALAIQATLAKYS